MKKISMVLQDTNLMAVKQMIDTPNQFTEQDFHFMRLALLEAQKAREKGEVPVGAVVVDQNDSILARAGNRSLVDSDPSGHAEMVAIRKAGKKLDNYRLPNTTLYATIEPCVMCTGAMIHARISRLVFGARDPKAGAVVSQYLIGTDRKLNHLLEVEGGLLEVECAELLTSFFKKKRH
jgi:tRNA(adenine34) deaminase